MSFKPSPVEEKTFELPPEGMFDAVCSGIVSVGWQRGEYQGTANKKNIIFLYFELSECDSEGNPFVMFAKFNNTTSSQGKFAPFYEKWTKVPYTAESDPSELVGMQARVLITHNKNADGTKTYANIDTALDNAAGKMMPSNIIVYDPEEHNQAVYESLPKFMQDMIQNRMTQEEVDNFTY